MGFLEESIEIIAKWIAKKAKSNPRLTNETLEEFIACIRAVYSSLSMDNETKKRILEFIDTYTKRNVIDNVIDNDIGNDIGNVIDNDIGNDNNSLPPYLNRDDNEIYTEYVRIYNEELKLKTKADVKDFIDKSIKELEEEYISTELSRELYGALMQYWHEKKIFYNL
jgi:hypothetical protein